MNFFGSPDFERMAADHDYDGLYRCLNHRNKSVRLQAAQTLAEMNDGSGWRFLMDAVRDRDNVETQIVAAAMLGELGHPRAVQVLGEALVKTRYEQADSELAAALRQALETIGGEEANEALRRAGYEPVGSGEAGEISDYEAQFVRPILLRTDQIHMLSAEQHLNQAVELREAELTERGLVEDSLALWLSPEWAYAWYLRGVLMEDLERSFEAALAYRRAIALDPMLSEAREALKDLEEESVFPDLQRAELLSKIASRDWQARRDAVVALGELAYPRQSEAEQVVDALIERLDDEEREVRHAVIEALGRLGDRRAVEPLLARAESSWLVRFAILQALAQLGSVEGLVTVLRREMNRIQERNPVFTSFKDPLLEVEYDLLMEIGVLALERTGDLDRLLQISEGNQWEEVEDAAAEAGAAEAAAEAETEADYFAADEEYDEEEDGEVEEDLEAYVDEVAQMASAALERLATPQIPKLDPPMLKRLAAVPDLTLYDLSEEEAEPVVVYDLSSLRQTARDELSRRK